MQRPQGFALTRTSLENLTSLYEIRGGFLNIFCSKGWFCIRCHFFLRICFRSGIDGRYSVFVYFVEPTFFGWNWLKIRPCYLDNPCVVIIAWIMWCVRQISPLRRYFSEAFPGAWRMAGVKVHVLGSLCRFKVCAHDNKKNKLFELVALVYTCIQECYFSIWNLRRVFYYRMDAIC